MIRDNLKYIKIKRIFDIVFSLILFLILFPVIIIIIILIKIDSKGPILFKQLRVGKNKNNFYIYKFRTMKTDSPKNLATHLINEPLKFITKIGFFLRRTSLDEIPQLINIIKGEMSLIGPRPALFNQLDLIAERDKYDVHSILPGITGLAQINGRDEIDIDMKAKYDGQYLREISFTLDMKIFFKTILKVLLRKNISEGAKIKKNINSESEEINK